MPIVGYMLGARIFEKHFEVNRAWKGTGQSFSLEPSGLRRVVRDLERAHISLGDGEKRPYASENAPLNKTVKRIVAARPLSAGMALAMDDLAFRIISADRSGSKALQAFHADKLVGRTLAVDLGEADLATYEAVGSSEAAA